MSKTDRLKIKVSNKNGRVYSKLWKGNWNAKYKDGWVE